MFRWFFFLALIFLFHCLTLIKAINNHTYTHVGSYKDNIYLIRGDLKRNIPANDNETLINLGFDPTHISPLAHNHFHSLHVGKNINAIHRNMSANSLDEFLRIFLEANNELQGRLIRDLFAIGPSINPCIVKLHGRLLAVTGMSYTTDLLQFKWLNYTTIPLASNDDYLGLNTNYRSANNTPVIGSDPRCVSIQDNKVTVVYTNRFETPRIRMGATDFTINPDTHKLEPSRIFKTLKWNSHSIEKNWSPFVYNNDVYLIQSINPLHVVGYVPVGSSEIASVLSSERAPLAYHPYNRFGHIRGGTNAIDMGSYYLALFHSVDEKYIIPGFQVYLFGAYTFTKEPPRRLLAISPQPVVDEMFYQGGWAPNVGRNRRVAYIVFPTSIILDGEDFIVSLGFQDYLGMIIRINMEKLLKSMEPVIYCEESEKDHHHGRFSDLKKHYCWDKGNKK